MWFITVLACANAFFAYAVSKTTQSLLLRSIFDSQVKLVWRNDKIRLYLKLLVNLTINVLNDGKAKFQMARTRVRRQIPFIIARPLDLPRPLCLYCGNVQSSTTVQAIENNSVFIERRETLWGCTTLICLLAFFLYFSKHKKVIGLSATNLKMEIPVVSFGAYKLGREGVNDDQLQDLGRQLKEAFTKVGFVYLQDTGITQDMVDAALDVSKKFFLLPEQVKMHYSRNSSNKIPNHGWVSLQQEKLNPRRPGDLKEAFNACCLPPIVDWPSDDVAPGFQDALQMIFMRCKDLLLRVLRVMAISLDLEPELFVKVHRHVGNEENCTTLRTLYYPAVDHETVKEDQVRCGEHSDYGSITLLFQSVGGLQVKNRCGEYINAPSIPGTVLVNIADLMQRWTSDIFTSSVHRVLLPPAGDKSTRQSLAFFGHPDNDAIITCCDGSDKYPPVTSLEYLNLRFNETY